MFLPLKTIISALLLIGLISLHSSVFATAPVNAKITSTAYLNYTGIPNPITASVSILVKLTPASPLLSAPTDQTVLENGSAIYTYTLTSKANGSDRYDITDTGGLTPTVGLSKTSVSAVFSINMIALGVTAANNAYGADTTAIISVPSDGTNDAAINDITAGDLVVIGGNTYTVAAGGIFDSGSVATMTLTSNVTTIISIGDLIAEQQSFTATINDVGAMSGIAPYDIVMDVTATSKSDGAATDSDQTTTTVIKVTGLTFTKFVRNVTDPNYNGSGVSVVYNGADGNHTYYDTAAGVIAEPGDVLEYLLQFTAPIATVLEGVTLTDSIPQFTTYVHNTTFLNKLDTTGDGVASPLVGGLLVNDTGNSHESGIVDKGATASVVFQVTID